MLNRQTHILPKESVHQKLTKHDPNHSINRHGKQLSSCILLDVPAETLAGITCYLDPPSLLSLARVHSWLNSHVKDDSTWRGAFLCQFLNIGPESGVYDDVKNLMLRLHEKTWRNEFIVRYKLIRRWEKSRNSTVAHNPVHAHISSMHMLSGTTLLTSSIQYGIASRSLPLTGKILFGFLNASHAGLGLGIGNPNAEFNSEVSACALTSEGGTARILWGFRHGGVGVVTIPRALDPSRRPVTGVVKSNVRDEHAGAVLDAVWDHPSKSVVATAGADAMVKVWDAGTMRCLWASQLETVVAVPEPYLKVAISVAQGTVVTVKQNSGDVTFWTGFQMQSLELFSAAAVEETRVPCPAKSSEKASSNDTNDAHYTVAFLHIDPYAAAPTVLVAYEDHPYFYRLRKNSTSDYAVEVTTFGDASFGNISTLVPFFAAAESSFVLVGDSIGCVTVYDWNTPFDPSSPVQCVRRFEAHPDGSSVTAIAWDGLTLVTGSSRGTSHVWDGLTFRYLRSFSSPISRVLNNRRHALGGGRTSREREPVRQIVLGPEKDIVLVGVGDAVLAWKAGPVSRNSPGGVRGRHHSGVLKKKNDNLGAGKYFEQVNLRQAVSETREMLKKESKEVHRANGKAKEQRAQLESMGLNESEAVDYLLMLSRDEALERENTLVEQSLTMEEGVFEVDSDYDEGTPPYVLPSHMISSFQSGMSTPRTDWAPTFYTQDGSPGSRASTEAESAEDATSSSLSGSEPAITNFPPIGTTPSSASSISIRSEPTADQYGSSSRASASLIGEMEDSVKKDSRSTSIVGRSSMSGSPQSRSAASASRSAWNTPLRKRSPVSASPSTSSSARSALVSVSSPSSSSVKSVSSSTRMPRDNNMDDELRFAIELSLAEAISLGQDV